MYLLPALLLVAACGTFASPFPMFAATDSGLYRRDGVDSAFRRVDLDTGLIPFGVAQYGPHIVVTGKAVLAMVSHDGGSTWRRGSETLIGSRWIPANVVNVDSVFVAFDGTDARGSIYISRDFGESWQESGWGVFGTLGRIWGIADANRFKLSFDQGAHWETLPERIRLSTVTSFISIPGGIWAMAYGGLHSWSSVRKTWSPISGAPGDIRFLASRKNRVWAGTKSGLMYTDDYGSHWDGDSNLCDSGVSVLRLDSGTVWAACGDRLFRGRAEGVPSWQEDGTGLPSAAIRGLALAENPADTTDPGWDPDPPAEKRVRDFCPLKPGHFWIYSRSYVAGRGGTVYTETTNRTFRVLSDSQADTVRWYRVSMTDSVVGYTEEIGSIAFGRPLRRFGQDRRFEFQIRETPDGALRTVLPDTLASFEVIAFGTMLDYAFRSRAVAPFWISDTSADGSHPEVVYIESGTTYRRALIRKDIGLTEYNAKAYSSYHEEVTYVLRRFHGDSDYVSIKPPSRLRNQAAGPRPKVRTFTGTEMRFRDRRLDGRLPRTPFRPE